MKMPSWQTWFLLAAAAVVLGMNAGGYDLWAPDEPRYGQIAREMLERGDWITPHINDERYQEKPPLFFWSIAIASLPFGDVTEWSARIPSILGAVITLFFTFLLARSLFSPQIGTWAMIVLATSAGFWWQARTAQIDMVLTAFTTMALYAFWQHAQDAKKRWLLLFFGALAAAILAKGPPGYLFALFLVFVFYRGQRDVRRGVHFWIGSLVIWGLFFAWYVPAHMMQPAAEAARELSGWENIWRNTIGRLMGASKFDPWPWSYVLSSAFDFLPWTLLFPWAAPWVWRHRHDGQHMRLLLSWIVPAFIFFSIIVTKRSIYILPLYPAFAILIAASIPDLITGEHARWRKRTAFVWGVLLTLLATAPWVLRYTEYAYLWQPNLAVFSLVAAAFAGDTFLRTFRTDARGLPVLFASHFAGLALMIALFVLPTVNQIKGAGAFCEPVRETVAERDDVRVFSLGFSREEYIFYAHSFHETVLTELVEVKGMEGMDLYEMAVTQKKMLDAIVDAVEDIEIGSYEQISDEDMAKLKAAMNAVVEDRELDPNLVLAFEEAIGAELSAFQERFESNGPAFAFVETENWRWMLPLWPELAELPVIKRREVGSRDMLLLGNASAAAEARD